MLTTVSILVLVRWSNDLSNDRLPATKAGQCRRTPSTGSARKIGPTNTKTGWLSFKKARHVSFSEVVSDTDAKEKRYKQEHLLSSVPQIRQTPRGHSQRVSESRHVALSLTSALLVYGGQIVPQDSARIGVSTGVILTYLLSDFGCGIGISC